MSKIISGVSLSQEIKSKMKEEVKQLVKIFNRPPHLAVICVGDNPASISYVKGKEKDCLEVGIKATTIHLDEKVSEKTLLDLIKSLNEDRTVDGILVQLPLPKTIDEHKVLDFIAPMKDVDGFHPNNVASLYLKRTSIQPCTPKGVIKLLKSENINLEGVNACVIGRSNIVGMPLAKMLLDENATVTICHSKTKNLEEITKCADLIISCVGKPKFIKASMVKDGCVVIDVGVNRLNGKLCGDVDFDEVSKKASYITKVPGGVGPMTRCCLLENTILTFKLNNKI